VYKIIVFLLLFSAVTMADSRAVVIVTDGAGLPLVWDKGCNDTIIVDCVQALEVRDTVTGVSLGEVIDCQPDAGSYCGSVLIRKPPLSQFGSFTVQTRVRYIDVSGTILYTEWLDNIIGNVNTPILFTPGGGNIKVK
jgi:hypothetical protein